MRKRKPAHVLTFSDDEKGTWCRAPLKEDDFAFASLEHVACLGIDAANSSHTLCPKCYQIAIDQLMAML